MFKPYILGGPTGDVIALPVDLEKLPDEVQVEGTTLHQRSSYHVSLVCIGEIMKKYAIADPKFKDAVIEDFSEYIKNNPVQFLGFKDEFRFVEEGEKKSLVVMCHIENLAIFYERMSGRYERLIFPPPTHITLYTLGKDKGIFLIDEQDVEERTHIIPKPEAITLRKL